MIYIVKYKKNGEENSISFYDILRAEEFFKYIFQKDIKI
jgi:hypothetical protein